MLDTIHSYTLTHMYTLAVKVHDSYNSSLASELYYLK